MDMTSFDLKDIVFDLDKTLITSSENFCIRLDEAIGELKTRRGVRIAIATGRIKESVLNLDCLERLTNLVDYPIILNDGASSLNLETDEYICYRTLDDNMVSMLNSFTDEYKGIVLEYDGNLLADSRFTSLTAALALRIPLSKFSYLSGLVERGRPSRCYVVGASDSLCDQLSLLTDFSITRLPVGDLTLISPNTNKEFGLAYHIPDIDLVTTMAIGDSTNDIELVSSVGMGVAVLGSTEDLSRVASVNLDVELATFIHSL